MTGGVDLAALSYRMFQIKALNKLASSLTILMIAVVFSAAATRGTHATPESVTPEVPALEPCRLEGFGGFRKIKAECGTLTVPLDPAVPNGSSIDLFIAKIPALTRTPAASAFTYIAGGPGQASTQAYVSMREAFELIRREHDIIIVDQRGTGKSNPQNCPLPDDRIDYDLENWSQEDIAKFTRECLEQLGQDTRFYTTSVAIQDLDRLRSALGYAQLDIYGISYGTRVAQHYLRRYPQNTRSVIIDGVVPVTIPLGPDLAINAQHALDIVFERCAQDSACRNTFGDIKQKFSELQARLRAETIAVTHSDPISGVPVESKMGYDHLQIAVRLMSYSPDTVSLLPLMINAAYEGSFEPFAAQAMLGIENLTNMLAYGMHNTIVCSEDIPFFAGYPVDRDRLTASYMGSQSYDSLIAMCKDWPPGPVDEDFKRAFSSPVPVLILSGTADPVTPVDYGSLAAGYLGNTRHITVTGQGHGQAHIGCMPRLMAAFVTNPDPTELDDSCLNSQHASPFFTSYSGPEP